MSGGSAWLANLRMHPDLPKPQIIEMSV